MEENDKVALSALCVVKADAVNVGEAMRYGGGGAIILHVSFHCVNEAH